MSGVTVDLIVATHLRSERDGCEFHALVNSVVSTTLRRFDRIWFPYSTETAGLAHFVEELLKNARLAVGETATIIALRADAKTAQYRHAVVVRSKFCSK